ncbi:MAG: hypothetical protein DMG45_00860, partial [Acidobacteria bacterium]
MTIASPCIDVCKMSEDKTVCIGCYRSLSEITNWSRLTDTEKIRVIAAAQERRTTLECQDTNPMNKLRIVSFLPAATEMAYALGLGDQLVGVSHECDFP